MNVRLIEGKERIAAGLISVLAFHGRVEDFEKQAAAWEKEQCEDWGAFDDDGTLMARIINNHFVSNFDGSEISNGGIGAVSTLPEYRVSGAVRGIFRELLPSVYKRGEVISTLSPFNHAFYRKFGYETICFMDHYCFDLSLLSGYKFGGKAKLWMPGESAVPFTSLYNAFAKDYNLSLIRDDKHMQNNIIGNDPWYKKRSFAYMLSENGEDIAYLIFRDQEKDGKRVFSVEDLAWKGRAGFKAILGFAARFTADYDRIVLKLPRGVELLSLIRTDKAYDIEKFTQQGYMLRVINAQKLLAAMRKPAGTDFVVRVRDEFIPENNASFRVTEKDVTVTEEPCDMDADVCALGQLACGAVTLSEALLRDDVEVFSKQEMLKDVFVRKDLYMADHF